jgi:hypothetical protein
VTGRRIYLEELGLGRKKVLMDLTELGYEKCGIHSGDSG